MESNTPAVPRNVVDLKKKCIARKEPLEIKLIKEEKADGVVTCYVIFNAGTFKGACALIAAHYYFPENGNRNAAFAWNHGGGQRGRGFYFAQQGLATIGINLLAGPSRTKSTTRPT